MNINGRYARLVLLACLALFVLWLGGRDFYSRGEPREVLVAQSMLQSGNWMLGVGYGGAVPSKPPLLHWLMAVFSLPAGELGPLTARLPSALASTCFLMFLFIFLKTRLGARPALYAVFLLMMSAEWFRSSTAARVDMLLTALLSAGLLRLYIWEEKGLKGLAPGATVLFALAMLAKGPVGVVLPGLIFAAYLLWRRVPFGRAALSCLLVFAPAFCIGAVWYLAASQTGGEAFSARVYYENVARFAGSMKDDPHAHSVFYLVASFLAGFLPWTPVGIFLFWRDRELVCSSLARFKSDHQSLWRFCLCVIGLVLAFYAIPPGKRGVYLLPLYPFVCILGGILLEGVASRGRRRLVSVLLSTVFAIELVLNAAVFPLVANRLSSRRFARQIDAMIPPEGRLYSFGNEFYGLSFYLRRTIYELRGIRPRTGDVLFLYTDNLQELRRNALDPDQDLLKLAESDYGVEDRKRRLGMYRVVGSSAR